MDNEVCGTAKIPQIKTPQLNFTSSSPRMSSTFIWLHASLSRKAIDMLSFEADNLTKQHGNFYALGTNGAGKRISS